MILGSIENQAILDAQELLKSFSSGDELLANFNTAFGSKFDRRFKRFVSDPLSLQQAY